MRVRVLCVTRIDARTVVQCAQHSPTVTPYTLVESSTFMMLACRAWDHDHDQIATSDHERAMAATPIMNAP